MTPEPQPPAAGIAEQPSGTERRRHVRHETSAPAKMALLGRSIEGRLRDIGAGGVGFETEDVIPVEPGNFVSVEFDCSRGGEPVRLKKAVRVLWTAVQEENGYALRVYGLEFEELLETGEIDLSFSED